MIRLISLLFITTIIFFTVGNPLSSVASPIAKNATSSSNSSSSSFSSSSSNSSTSNSSKSVKMPEIIFHKLQTTTTGMEEATRGLISISANILGNIWKY